MFSVILPSMNSDSYNFVAYYEECKEKRGVSCSIADIRSGKPVKVYAIACDHSWTLTPEQTEALRKNSTVAKTLGSCAPSL